MYRFPQPFESYNTRACWPACIKQDIEHAGNQEMVTTHQHLALLLKDIDAEVWGRERPRELGNSSGRSRGGRWSGRLVGPYECFCSSRQFVKKRNAAHRLGPPQGIPDPPQGSNVPPAPAAAAPPPPLLLLAQMVLPLGPRNLLFLAYEMAVKSKRRCRPSHQ